MHRTINAIDLKVYVECEYKVTKLSAIGKRRVQRKLYEAKFSAELSLAMVSESETLLNLLI